MSEHAADAALNDAPRSRNDTIDLACASSPLSPLRTIAGRFDVVLHDNLRSLLVIRARRAPGRLVSWVTRRRTALTCAGLVLLIALTSLLLAGLAWRAMVDQQLADSGSAAASSDLTESSVRERTPGATGSLEAPDRTKTSVAPAPPSSKAASSSPKNVLLSGPVLAAASASIILVIGAAGAWLVLRRHRRAEEAEEAVHSASPTVEALDGPESEGPSAGTEDVPVLNEHEASARDLEAEAVLQVEPVSVDGEARTPIQDSADRLLEPVSVPAGGPPPAVSDDVMLPALRHQLDASVDAGRTSLLVETPAGATYAEMEQCRISAEREVLYERRAAPRITFLAAALLEWKEQCYPVMVLDLSESGLRCELSARDTTSPKPGNAEYVRISFILPSGRVNLKAQIAWNRRAPGGTQFGLQFLKINEEATAQLRVVCLAGVPV